MGDGAELRALLRRMDGAGYGAYKDLRGSAWDLDGLRLRFDHIQGDPYAAPSRVRVRVRHGLPELEDDDALLATEDWFLRRMVQAFEGGGRVGSGRGGELSIYAPGPEVVGRTALRLVGPDLELRLRVGLPARGRRVMGSGAWSLLSERLCGAVQGALGADRSALWAQVDSVRRQRALRRALRAAGLVAFVADGSVLPRASGVDPRPLAQAVPFHSPESLRVHLPTPFGPVSGMGIPTGVTVIVGGGFHGKSTLLQALARGHLDHVPGDGREGVVSSPDCVKLRAEDGRVVHRVDLSCLLRALPGGRGTRPFSSLDASGSTSQAAALVEAVQAGADCVLLDEDTCATNLMVRDARIRALVPREREPITPLVERVRQLHGRWGVSMVLVIGGVGDYLGVADTVISMEDYRAVDRGAEAAALGIEVPEAEEPLEEPLARVLDPRCLDVGKIQVRDERRVRFGEATLELSAVEQILDPQHAWTLAQAMAVLGEQLAGPVTLDQALDHLEALLEREGLEALSPNDSPDGGLVWPRRHELAAALNRYRGLRISTAG